MTETHPEKRLIGYARVSTYGQTLDSQLEQLRKAGCNGRNIYKEKVTGARPDRRELLRMLNRLAPGDVVTVTRIDRLARSTFDLFGYRQAHRRRQGAIPIIGGTMGRYRHQHRALDAGGTRRLGRC
jgi:predicted site-specific integrase-resolvase